MRDRRARLGMVLLVLSFPYLIDAASSGRRISETSQGSAPRSAAALVRLGSDLGVETAEAVVVAGLLYCGWQRRRLVNLR